MLPEQVWPHADLPGGRFKLGDPAGSAMPLCWAHAEYIALTKSAEDGRPIDRPDCVYQRYAKEKALGSTTFWLFARQSRVLRAGKSLTILLDAAATVRYSTDAWQTQHDLATCGGGLGLHHVTLDATRALEPGDSVCFTFRWEAGDRWQNENFSATIVNP
jgi:glucoamylase